MATNFNKLNEMADRIRQNRGRIVRAMGAQGVTFVKQRFIDQAWLDTRREPWPARKPGSARDAGRKLLIDKEHLLNSQRILQANDEMAEIGSTDPKARIHNEGGVTHPLVTKKMRKFAWAKYYETGENKWKGLALTKKTHLDVKIPKRKFNGLSHVANQQMKRVAILQISKYLK